MGDVSAEPSMEDILSSIKRIIADEGEPAPIRARRPARPPRAIEPEPEWDDGPEVLELNDPIAAPAAAPVAHEEPVLAKPEARSPEPAAPPSPAPPPPAPPTLEPSEPGIVSHRTAAAARGSLEALSRMMVRPEPASDGTLEGLVREMLRPMLAQWLDQHLPPLVEEMVEREIAKITGAPARD